MGHFLKNAAEKAEFQGMKLQKAIQFVFRMLTASLLGYVLLSADTVYALEPATAEYKCTTDCSLCITFPKKTVCSAKYADDSEDYLKGKKLSKFVNEGLIIPTPDLKAGFNLNAFATKFFDCDLMVKKVAQIQEATQNMCVRKTVKYKKTVLVPRSPASASTKSSSEESQGTVVKKTVVRKPTTSKKIDKSSESEEEAQPEEMGELIQKMDSNE